MSFEVSILQYLGLVGDGVLVLLAIMWKEKYYEATFFYNAEDIVLTAADDLEKDLNHPIKEDKEYVDILKSILKQIEPYNQVKTKLKPFGS